MRNRRQYIGAVIFAWMALVAANARAAAPAWSLDGQMVFARMASLETAAVNAIAQDRQGFLWFGTQSNLLRWDGYQLHPYARNPDAAGSLPDNYIRSLLVDERDQLWVGTNSGGLSRYDAKTDSFVSYPVGAGGTSDGTILALISDHHGGLWIGTGHGIDHLDGATGRLDPRGAGQRRDAVTTLLLDSSGSLWVGTRKGLLRRGAADSSFVPYPIPTSEGSAPIIRTLMQDKSGRIWIGLDQHGVFTVEPGDDQPRRLLQSPGSGAPLEEDITAICAVDGTEIWLGTAQSGIVRVNTATWRITRDRHEAARPRGLPSNQIDSLYLDRGGIMWVGTRSALNSADPRQRLIQTFYGGRAPDLLIQDDSVSAMLALPDGRIWMALVGGGVEIVDPGAGAVGFIGADPAHPDRALPKAQVITMARGDDGNVFLGTAAGLYRAGLDGRSVRRLDVPTLRKTADVRSLLVSDGYLWLGGLDGLCKVDVRPDGSLTVDRCWEKELGDPRVRTVVKGRGADIWIGTMSGVSRLDSASGTVTQLPIDPRNPQLLPGGYVSSMLTDRKGRFWVATFGRGIQVERGRDSSGRPIFRRLTQSDGLPQNSVDAMLQDADGNIWASTDGGLARIDVETLKIRAFRIAQGVGVDGFFTANAETTAAGDLLFGGMTGLVVVHPEQFSAAVQAPPMVVTDMRVGGRTLPAALAGAPAGLTLGSKDRSLGIEFAALDYIEPDVRRYSYRLQSFDADWLETSSSRRVATYTNLPPGNYNLQLRSAAPGEEWSRPLDIAVHVQPAWYERAAARALAVIAVLALVFGLTQGRTAMLRRRQSELESIVAERTAELRRNQKYLESMAYIDVLTGLPNRRSFNENLRRLIAGCERQQTDFVLMLVDLDGFKCINDTDGHDAGDAVLVHVADRLRTLLRETDLATRLGGDEFGLVLVQPRDKAAVDSACARILKKLGEPIALTGRTVTIGASIGISKVSGGYTTPDELCKAADLAMYEAKRSGRNTWRWDERSAKSASMMASARMYPPRSLAG